jgi:hypothetical protein
MPSPDSKLSWITYHIYAGDDDFDAADGAVRLDTATNPYDPN